jgi:protein phosphatase 1 regulatory subunit 12A
MSKEKQLFKFAKAGNLEEINKLIEEGVEIDTADVKGLTPLILAVKQENIPVVEMLIQRGADINKGDNEGKTPLYWAL